MKRSEMIRNIIQSIFYNNAEDLIFEPEEAELVLKDLESFGMRPPGYEALMRNGQKYNKDLHQGADTFWCNDWEPENDV